MSRSPMRTISLRNLAAHKVRLVLTVLSVVLGTAFITGALVFTSSLSATFDDMLAGEYEGVDVVVQPPQTDPHVLSDERIAAIEALPQVAQARPKTGLDSIIVTDSAGKKVGFAATQPHGEPFNDTTIAGQRQEFISGVAPREVGEVAINEAATKDTALDIGQTITVVTAKDRAEVTISGIIADSDAVARPEVLLTPQQWRSLYTDGQSVPMLLVRAADSASAADAEQAIVSANPDLEIETGAARAERTSAAISESLDFINYFLVAFGLIGLVTGVFIIANTFAMLVAQRIREFALLRSIGISRSQLTRSVIVEAALVGLVGSLIGVATGFGLVYALTWLLEETVGMVSTGISWDWSSILIPVIAGVLITVIGAWAPAARAGATPPVAAMRSGDHSSQPLLGRTVAGAVAFVLTAALIVIALTTMPAEETAQRASVVGIAALLAIIGAWLTGPVLASIIASAIGKVVGMPFGATGRLASTNSKRNPRRAASTAFALTLGLALVASVGMLGASMKASLSDWIDENLKADFVVAAPFESQMNMPLGTIDAVRATDHVQHTASTYLAPGLLLSPEEAAQLSPDELPRFDGAAGLTTSMQTFFDGDLGFWYSLTPESGDIDLSKPDAGVAINLRVAESRGWSVGSPVVVVTPSGMAQTTVTGTYDSPTAPTMISTEVAKLIPGVNPEARPAWLIPREIYVAVDGGVATGAGGISLNRAIERARGPLEDSVEQYVVPQVSDRNQYSDLATGGVDSMLTIVYGLLGLAIVISVLGILNTLALSVIERRQEIGMLRAIGMQRSSLRLMVTLESVQVAIFGALLGAVLGLALGYAFLSVVFDATEDIRVPWGLLATMIIGSGVVGVLAALWPAIRAAKIPPLAAMANE
ncbi:FtsX-like permease family protein [Corynebacterium sp. TAE3-ERU12]|uniref:ABC transporter permease n=1 Tax=Corynebacterium sp. TAE3-ERU12 TaxID=2849491 RepID=UPI001C466780|nr:ABC transporter permease [Corynebacterium sp. TAE3-ERU12]MBV7296107.1 FtsX-like permease family protein [Corynebacterium sp. TAE3-ERU12]